MAKRNSWAESQKGLDSKLVRSEPRVSRSWRDLEPENTESPTVRRSIRRRTRSIVRQREIRSIRQQAQPGELSNPQQAGTDPMKLARTKLAKLGRVGKLR